MPRRHHAGARSDSSRISLVRLRQTIPIFRADRDGIKGSIPLPFVLCDVDWPALPRFRSLMGLSTSVRHRFVVAFSESVSKAQQLRCW
jgi:hypothetical protein